MIVEMLVKFDGKWGLFRVYPNIEMAGRCLLYWKARLDWPLKLRRQKEIDK